MDLTDIEKTVLSVIQSQEQLAVTQHQAAQQALSNSIGAFLQLVSDRTGIPLVSLSVNTEEGTYTDTRNQLTLLYDDKGTPIVTERI